MTKFLTKIVDWLTAGYPEDVPGPDRVPLLALLRRRLTDDEVRLVAEYLMDIGKFDRIDASVLITWITDECPARRTSSGFGSGWPCTGGRSTIRGTSRMSTSQEPRAASSNCHAALAPAVHRLIAAPAVLPRTSHRWWPAANTLRARVGAQLAQVAQHVTDPPFALLERTVNRLH